MSTRGAPWRESAAALLDAPMHRWLEAEAQRQATQLAGPLVADCAKLAEPFQHIVPLLTAVHLLHDLAALCGDDPAFIDAAAEFAHRMRRAGALTLQDMIGSPPA